MNTRAYTYLYFNERSLSETYIYGPHNSSHPDPTIACIPSGIDPV